MILGINAILNKKISAWEFINYYILAVSRERELHRDSQYSFSVMKDTFELQLYPEVTPRRTYHYINFDIGETYLEDFTVSDKERDELRDMAQKVVWSTSFAPVGTIGNIIVEEIISFLEDDKSTKEVADIIQSRVSLYMAE